MNVEDQLRDHLRARAEQIDVEVSPRRAHRRRPRRLGPALAAATVVIVAIGGAALLTRGGDPAAPPVEVAPVIVTTTAPAVPMTGSSGLQVARSSFSTETSGMAGPVHLVRLGDGYLALSVGFAAPEDSVADGPTVRVWRSDDGIEWIEIDGPSPFGEAWPRYVLSTGAQVVVLAEGFRGEPDTFGTVADAYTTTDGREWRHRPLAGPVFADLSPYQFVSVTLEGAAAGPAGIVAVGTSFVQVDVDAVAQDVFGLERGEYAGWTVNEEHLRIELTDGTTRSVTYAELGITAPPGTLPLVGRVAWVSTGGDEWDLVEDVRLPVPNSPASVAATDAGFVAVGFGEQGPGMSTSPDGRVWSAADLTPFDAVGEFLGVAGDGGGAVAIGLTRDGTVAAWSTNDGTAWSRLPDLPVGDSEVTVAALATGPLGVVAVLAEYPSVAEDYVEPPMVINKDGLELRFDFAAGRLLLTDAASGDVLVDEAVDFDSDEPPDFVTLDDEGRQIIINDPASGEPLFSYSPEDQEEVDDASYESAELTAAAGRSISMWYLGAERWEAVLLPEGAQAIEFEVADVVVGEREFLYSVLATRAPGLDPQIWRVTPP